MADYASQDSYRHHVGTQQRSGPVVVEDLIEGLNEWRNIQDIVRITFKAFHDVLKAQGDAIKALERALESKATASEVAAALQHKANSVEVSQRLREVETQLMAKADVADMDRRALKSELDASLNIHMTDVYAVISTKADDAEIRMWKEQVERTQQQARGEMVQLGSGLHDIAGQVDQKASAADVSEALATKADAAEVDQALRDKVGRKVLAETLARKADKAAAEELGAGLRSVAGEVAHKADLSGLQQLQQMLESTIAATSDELRSLRGGLDGTAAELKRAVDLQGGRLSDVQGELGGMQGVLEGAEAKRREDLSRMVDSGEMYRMLAAKADITQVHEALATKANVATVRALIDKVEEALGAARKHEGLQQDIVAKASTTDVCTLLDSKANIEDVNRALLQVCQELEGKAGLEELGRVVKDQSIINASLCADMSLARWLWKSAKTKQGGAVPWNVEALNSDPENFLWEKDKATIITVVPGLYEVTFGFFSKKKPTVQLLVNGEPVLSAVNSSSYVIHHSSGRLATVSAHPAGNVTGLTCIDFLSLPAKAKLAITYQGEEKGEGFFCVKKL